MPRSCAGLSRSPSAWEASICRRIPTSYDEKFQSTSNEYYEQFAQQIPECDKVMLGLIAEKTRGCGSLLDIGCSTGNLLLHVSRAFYLKTSRVLNNEFHPFVIPTDLP